MWKTKTLAILLIATFSVLTISCGDKKKQPPAPKGDSDWKYFGLASPGKTPALFSPEIVSTRRNERDFTISPAGNVMFFSMVLPGNTLSVILYLRFDGFFWSEPKVTTFSGQYSDMEPAFSPDGNKLFFASNRPNGIGDRNDDYDIWYIENTEKGWSTPINVGSPVNTEKNESYPSVASDGTLYFTTERKDSIGGEDIFYSSYKDGKYLTPVNLGEPVNTTFQEFNAFVAPDKSYLIFSSIGREDDLGEGDLYISHRIQDNLWSEPKNMGTNINSDKLDYCPFVSPEGKFLFFTSQRIDPALKVPNYKNLPRILQLADGVENGLGNIFWVEFEK